MSREAYEEREILKIENIDDLLAEFPDFIKAYCYDVERNLLPSTLLAYLEDLKRFFIFLTQNNPSLNIIKEISIDYLNKLTINDFNEFFHERSSLGEKSLSRYTSSIKSLFKFLFSNHYIDNNAYTFIKTPKIRTNENLTYLNKSEVENMMRAIEHGTYLKGKQIDICEKQRIRDYTLIFLLVHTGLRVSECSNLDISDIDLKNDMIKLVRKTKKESYIYIPKPVRQQLEYYLEYRYTLPATTQALFLNRFMDRLGVRAIQRIVKKYTPPEVVGLKHVSPHKLRSTYGMALYEATDDIYMVADALGHKSVETTKNYYTTVTDERKQRLKHIDLYKNK